jgi:hypothetical protein
MTTAKDNKVSFGISMDADVFARLDSNARALNLSRSAMNNMILRDQFGMIPTEAMMMFKAKEGGK